MMHQNMIKSPELTERDSQEGLFKDSAEEKENKKRDTGRCTETIRLFKKGYQKHLQAIGLL